MADTVDQVTRSEIMRKVRSTDTSPEMRVRRAVHAAGFRFRLHRKDVAGTPDLLFPRYCLAVFVHGCFWHWHGCRRSRMPAANREYWTRKIERNCKRDEETIARLEAEGWKRRVIWECELKDGIEHLLAELKACRGGSSENDE